MQLEEMKPNTILEKSVFDYLFSIEERVKHLTERYSFEDRARELNVLSKFKQLYNAHKKQIDKNNMHHDKKQDVRYTKFESDEYPELICGTWQCDETGVNIPYDRGVNIACYHPIMPVKRLVNIESHTEKVVIAFKRDGYWREHVIDREVLSSASRVVSGLSRYGAMVTSETAKMLVKYLVEIESYNTLQIPKQLSTGKMGWIGSNFMPYVDDKIVFDSEDRFKDLYDSITKPKGSQGKYIQFIKNIRQNKRLEPKLAIVTSLASILVSICGSLPFIVHFYGESGKGKTVCLMLAASVWGDCNEGGFIADPKSTPTAFEMRLNMLNHLPFICDDMAGVKKKFQSLKGADFADFIYLVCNGQGNARSNVHLGVNAIPKWKNCSITSSEKPLTQETSQGGELNRVIEIEVEQGYLFNDVKAVADFERANYGFLGQLFVNAINEIGHDAVKQINKDFRNRIYDKDTEREKEGKQVESMAVLLTADKILTDHILKDNVYLDFDTMYNLIRSNKQMSDNERALDFIRDEVTRNKVNFGEFGKEKWGYANDDGWVEIIPSVFDEIANKGNFTRNMFIKWAVGKGIAETNKGETAKTVKKDGKSVRVVRLMLEMKTQEEKDDFMVVDNKYEQIPFNETT